MTERLNLTESTSSRNSQSFWRNDTCLNGKHQLVAFGEESIPHFGSSMSEPEHKGEIQPGLCLEVHIACYAASY